jgi:hypothetical protein
MTKKQMNEAPVTQKIIIVQSGWVFCGEVSDIEGSPDLVRVNNAYNIRVWGTTQGVGELALHGKRPETILDVYGVVTLPKSAILAYIDCVTKIESRTPGK